MEGAAAGRSGEYWCSRQQCSAALPVWRSQCWSCDPTPTSLRFRQRDPHDRSPRTLLARLNGTLRPHHHRRRVLFTGYRPRPPQPLPPPSPTSPNTSPSPPRGTLQRLRERQRQSGSAREQRRVPRVRVDRSLLFLRWTGGFDSAQNAHGERLYRHSVRGGGGSRRDISIQGIRGRRARLECVFFLFSSFPILP